MERPNPDEVLARIKAEESHRGKLKIFFGAAAGVGKTYTMLESASQSKKDGVDVIIGYVETHKRTETEALLKGLEILPRKLIPYKNVELHEFDIDLALKRNPRLILVDELAHTNAPGSRHPKRWQDVEELLDKGIDVFTTLNVQHCESANDIVAQITGISVHETVPDTFVEEADEIKLVDIPTEDLLKRLGEGKVYLGERAELAAKHFFQPGNLIALRQLALRYTQHNVDAKLQSYKQAHSISKIWNVRDSFLIGVSPSPSTIRLIRAGKRIASDLGAVWTVAYVETTSELRPEDKKRISESLRFAEHLGAQVVTLIGNNIAETLISYARSKNISKIIVGKPGKPKLRDYFFGSVTDKLARSCGEIDLYLISGDEQVHSVSSSPPIIPPFSWRNFWWTTGIVSLCTAFDGILYSHLALVNLVMVYLLGVTWVAFRYGRRMSMLASFLSVIFFDFFFVPPHLNFAVADVQYIVTFFVMLTVGVSIAHLTGQLRRQTNTMQLREDRTQIMYALSRDLSKSSYPDELFETALKHIKDFCKCGVVIFRPDINNKLAIRFSDSIKNELSSHELAVAQWVLEHNKPAGKNTDTLPGAKGLFFPLTGSEKTLGVIGVFPNEDNQFADSNQFHILEMFVIQTAMAVEGALLSAASLEAESKIVNERIKNMLFTTFSQGLSTPLKSISQTASELLKPENIINESKRAELIEKMHREVEQLNTLINELPSIIESVK
jgi:two-component system, OmpR family, sensor histidine kinase KdpD